MTPFGFGFGWVGAVGVVFSPHRIKVMGVDEVATSPMPGYPVNLPNYVMPVTKYVSITVAIIPTVNRFNP